MDPKKDNKKEETVSISAESLLQIQEHLAEMERGREEDRAKMAGLETMLAEQGVAQASGEAKLREKKTFEPKFRTVRLRKFPMFGGPDKGFIVGWTNKGAYEEVDRTGVSPQIVNYIDVIYLGHEKKDGKIRAEKIRLLDLLNKGEQIHCKILKMERKENKIPTNEMIDITIWDPQHGLVQTGEQIDGFITESEIKYTIQVPGHEGEVVIDSEFVNG